MPFNRRTFLAAAAVAAVPRPGASQGEPPRPLPRLIKRTDWAANPRWRARIDARTGFIVADVEVLRRLDDDLILLVREEPPNTGDAGDTQHVRLERRDAAGRVLWQQAVPGLPTRFGRFDAKYIAGTGSLAALLVMTFLPVDNRRQAAYGRIVEVDERAGRLRALGGIARPRTRRWIDDEVFEFHGALRLDGDRLALYGGFGGGPYQWWLALMRLDGTRLWQVLSHTSAGSVRALRAVPDGFEASVEIIMSWPNAANVGSFRMRFDEMGKLVASVKRPDEGPLFFAPDRSAATIAGGPPQILIVEDRYGRRRALAVLPANASLRDRLDDGSFTFFDRSEHELVVTADGRTAFHIERDIRYEAILADGSILSATCAADDCRARDLAFCRRPW